MAVSKELMTTTLSIEVESGVDKDGNPSYKNTHYKWSFYVRVVKRVQLQFQM